MQPTARRVPGEGGLSLALLEWSAEGEPLLLLHGVTQRARVWQGCAPALAARYRVLAYDARGHGGSDHHPDADYSHPGLAADLECVADHLGLERLAIVGHSMGAYTAIYFAARHPERVTRLALVDASPDLSASARVARASARTSAQPPKRGAAPARAAREPGFDPRVLRPRVVPGRPSMVDEPERWMREEGARLEGFLARIPCPTLILRGEKSPVLAPEVAERLVSELMADARCETIPGAGHAPMLENAPAFEDALRRFFL